MKLNKKGQMTPTGVFFGNFIVASLVVFGLIQMLAFAWPGAGTWVDSTVMTYFGGATIVLLFLAAGALGTVVNEASARLISGSEPLFTKRIWAFFGFGIAVVIIGFAIGAAGQAGMLPATAIQTMILP